MVVLAAVCAGLTWLAASGPAWLSFWEDDGVYMATAKSLSEGKGYRHAELPGEPWQTKYPPMWPWVLAGVWKAWPAYPGNMAAVTAVNGALSLAGLCGALVVARRRLGIGPLSAGAGVVSASVGMFWWTLSATAMSEMLFAALTMWALAALPGGDRGEGSWWRFSQAGVLAALAVLTRTIGVSLAVAMVVSCLWKRRWMGAVLAGVPSVMAWGGWEVWRSAAGARNAAIPEAGWLYYDLDYLRSGVAPDALGIARTAWFNGWEMPWGLFAATSNGPRVVLGSWVMSGGAAAVTAYAMIGLASGLCVYGGWVSWRSGGAARVTVWTVVLTVVMLLGWAFPPGRFLVPLAPVLCVWIVEGARRGVAVLLGDEGLGGGAGNASSRSAGGAVAAVIVAGLLAWSSVTQLARLVNRPEFRARVADAITSDAELIRGSTEADAVVSVRGGGALHLLTGRKVVAPSPSDNTYGHFYPDDRAWWWLGMMPDTPGALARHRALLEDSMLESLDGLGVTHVVVRTSGGGRDRNLAKFVEAHEERFRLVTETSDRQSRLYAVVRRTP